MSEKRESDRNQEMKENTKNENKQIRADKDKIQSERIRYKNADKIYE
ncbi:hypothetical protein GN156_15640 [bacterium LRH843]|nr:hypothetical protein [bacterium LRH843]